MSGHRGHQWIDAYASKCNFVVPVVEITEINAVGIAAVGIADDEIGVVGIAVCTRVIIMSFNMQSSHQ